MEAYVPRDPEIFPSRGILESALGRSYPVFEALINKITGSESGMTIEWRHYRDGGAWLCKSQYKKNHILAIGMGPIF
jgi:hypothetical protein